MTNEDLERLIGEKVPANREMQLVGDRLFRRDGDSWHEYAAYPDPKGDGHRG